MVAGQEKSEAYPVGFTLQFRLLVDAMNSEDKTKGYRVLTTMYLQYQPIEEILVKTTFSPTMSTKRRGEYYGGLSLKNKQGLTMLKTILPVMLKRL